MKIAIEMHTVVNNHMLSVSSQKHLCYGISGSAATRMNYVSREIPALDSQIWQQKVKTNKIQAGT